MTDLTSSDLVQLFIAGCFGLYLSLAVVRLFRGRALTAVLTLGFWIVAFGVVITGYSYRDALGGVAERVVATVVPGVPMDVGGGQVAVMRGLDGQFTVKAKAGATRLSFVFDTGASTVVLRAEDAIRLGLDVRHLSYNVAVGTANGRAMAAEAILPELSIGSLREPDVPVLVVKAGALHENLLGMTFLNRLAGYSVERNKLVLQGRSFTPPG